MKLEYAEVKTPVKHDSITVSCFLSSIHPRTQGVFHRVKKIKIYFHFPRLNFLKFIMLQAAIYISFRGLNFIPIWVSFRVRVTQKIFTPVWNFKPVWVSFRIRVTCPLDLLSNITCVWKIVKVFYKTSNLELICFITQLAFWSIQEKIFTPRARKLES